MLPSGGPKTGAEQALEVVVVVEVVGVVLGLLPLSLPLGLFGELGEPGATGGGVMPGMKGAPLMGAVIC